VRGRQLDGTQSQFGTVAGQPDTKLLFGAVVRDYCLTPGQQLPIRNAS
jgi:hypothetical protein